jgi:hypothetical protein
VTIISDDKRERNLSIFQQMGLQMYHNREPKSPYEVTVRTHSKNNNYNKKQGFGGAGSDCH